MVSFINTLIIIIVFTVLAFERNFNRLIILMITYLQLPFVLVHIISLLKLALIILCPIIITSPNRAHVIDWTKLRSMQFVQEMLNYIRSLNKFTLSLFQGKLNLHKNPIFIEHMNLNIFCVFFKAILDLNNLKLIRVFLVYSFKLAIQSSEVAPLSNNNLISTDQRF